MSQGGGEIMGTFEEPKGDPWIPGKNIRKSLVWVGKDIGSTGRIYLPGQNNESFNIKVASLIWAVKTLKHICYGDCRFQFGLNLTTIYNPHLRQPPCYYMCTFKLRNNIAFQLYIHFW